MTSKSVNIDQDSKKEEENTQNYEERFPLHAAILKNDLKEVFRIVEEGTVDLNERDHRGNPPLHLAIHFLRKEMFYLLMDMGVNTSYKNGGGWSALQEAIASGDREMVEELFRRATVELNSRFERIIPMAITALVDLPNFYMELSWSVGSWVPLVSKLCPSDKYRIWKSGKHLRIDTTLIGFENLQWVRGNVSFLFNGSASTDNSHIIIVNHDKKKVEYAFESFKKYAVNQHNPRDVNSLLSVELNRMQIRTEKVSFSKVRSWFGPPKKEMVGEWNSTCYDVNGVERLFIKRVDTRRADKKSKSLRTPITPSDLSSFSIDDYFHGPLSSEEPKGIGLLYKHETRKIRVKEHKGKIWMCPDFPVSVNQILPIFALLSPSGKHFEKLESFIKMQLPEDGFPVKIEIPIFPTINATVTFGVFNESEIISDEIFAIPDDYELLTNRSMLFSSRNTYRPPSSNNNNNNNNNNNANNNRNIENQPNVNIIERNSNSNDGEIGNLSDFDFE